MTKVLSRKKVGYSRQQQVLLLSVNGYRANEEKEIEIVPDEAAVVREIYSLYIKGLSVVKNQAIFGKHERAVSDRKEYME